MPAPITQKQFHEISRAIKAASRENKYNSTKIAKQFNISVSTANTIKKTRTWPGFQAHNAARAQARTAQTKTATVETTTTEVKAPVAEGLQEEQLANDLDEQSKYVTRAEFERVNDITHGRMDIISAIYRAIGHRWVFQLLFGRDAARAVQQLVELEKKRNGGN